MLCCCCAAAVPRCCRAVLLLCRCRAAAAVPPAGVYLMSPMLHSLTRNVSEDSVIAMIAGLCITHLFLHDYK
jgi:hypothetical protein